MGSERQERAVMPENMGAGGPAQKWTCKWREEVPIHSPEILLMENEILKMKDISFELIWFFVFDFSVPCLSEFVTFLFES